MQLCQGAKPAADDKPQGIFREMVTDAEATNNNILVYRQKKPEQLNNM